MPRLVIDDLEIEVPEGTKVIEAAERLGIMIPRFCYHPALGSVGACRVCAVKFLQGPFKGVQMSCMIDAQDGMVVSTTDEVAVDFRKHVLEWLMLHHPHDCPVCDEGGHCLLQDMTVSGGHGIRRYRGMKRTYRDQYLGPLLQHEMNRCIHCYRCARFYQEFSGYHDLGVMQIGNRTYFGRHKDGILESPFSGNLSDICPTGVYTDKPSRFKGRRWDYERRPSLCINCALGCHTVASSRYREVVRQEARFSAAVNGYFICDRGRYGFYYASHATRPRRARVAGEAVPFEQAVQTAAAKLAGIGDSAGPQAIACMGSGRSGLETQAMLKRVCGVKGWQGPSYFMDSSLVWKVKTAVSRLEPQLAVSLRELEAADFILVVGADPVNEAPMLALAMRQARRGGADIAVIDTRPITLPFRFMHLPAALDDIDLCLSLSIKTAVDPEAARKLSSSAFEFYESLPKPGSVAAPLEEQRAVVAQKLRDSQGPIIVCGTDVVRPSTPALAADCALLLQAMNKPAGLFYLLPGANAFGGALLSAAEDSYAKVIEDIESGTVKALILAECDPFWGCVDQNRLALAVEKLELLIVLDYVNSPAAQKAHVFLPTETLYEAGGVFINQEGRLQTVPPAYRGGAPIAQVGGGSHPPRVYGVGIPAAEPRAAWVTLNALAGGEVPLDEAQTQADLWDWLAESFPIFPDLRDIDELPEDGLRLSAGAEGTSRFSLEPVAAAENRKLEGYLELIPVDWTFGTEELSAYSPPLRKVEREPCLLMQSGEAEGWGLRDGDRVAIQTDKGSVEIRICVVEGMAAGIGVMPRHRQLAWQFLETGGTRLRRDQIRKVTGEGGC